MPYGRRGRTDGFVGAVTRGRVTRTALVLLVAFGFAFQASVSAKSFEPQPDRVVYPTDQWPADVDNVQAAVAFGGTVLLKATDIAGRPTAFNFGVFEGDPCQRQVGLLGDVSLLGETAGDARTTIRGGYRPVLIGVSGCPGRIAPHSGRTRVEGITFVGPVQAAIDIYKATDVVIRGNQILDVDARGIGVGVNVFGGGAQRRITGSVTIEDNIIQFQADPDDDFVHAIVVADVPADVEINRNRILTTQSFTGILVVRQVERTVRIIDNDVAPHPHAPGFEGIGVYIYANDRWDQIRASAPVYEVVGNRVVSESYGIGLVGQRGSIDAPLIERNQISIAGDFPRAEGLAFNGNVSDARIASNRFDGAGAFAIAVYAFEPGQVARANTFVGNNLTQFRAGTADVLLDASTFDTVLAGSAGTVIDEGAGNRITGMSKIGHGEHIGQQVARSRRSSEPDVPHAEPDGS